MFKCEGIFAHNFLTVFSVDWRIRRQYNVLKNEVPMIYGIIKRTCSTFWLISPHYRFNALNSCWWSRRKRKVTTIYSLVFLEERVE